MRRSTQAPSAMNISVATVEAAVMRIAARRRRAGLARLVEVRRMAIEAVLVSGE